MFFVWIFFGFHNALCEEVYVPKSGVAQGRGNFTWKATSEKNITKKYWEQKVVQATGRSLNPIWS